MPKFSTGNLNDFSTIFSFTKLWIPPEQVESPQKAVTGRFVCSEARCQFSFLVKQN